MWVVHQRLAELWTIKKNRPLTESELGELEICLEANAKRAWKVALLKNLSLMASMTDDMDWQHDLCAKIDREMEKDSA